MNVLYGTSDEFLNFAEVIMLKWIADYVGGSPMFFIYPKGPDWLPSEKALYAPYEPPSLDAEESFRQAGLPPWIKIISLQFMAEGAVGDLTLGQIAGMIRSSREIQAFRALNFVDQKPVMVSSKDRRWREKYAAVSLREAMSDSAVKIGGAFIYFIYGAFLAVRRGIIGVLPGKQAPDVLGAFAAGENFSGDSANIFHCGEFDFMTRKQWEMRVVDRKWRKAPAFAMRRLLESELREEVRLRILAGHYAPLVFDEAEDRFYWWS